jgi:hypothetical protein
MLPFKNMVPIKLDVYNSRKEKPKHSFKVIEIMRGEDLGKRRGIPLEKDFRRRKMRFQTAESLVGKCDKTYDDEAIECEIYRTLNKSNPGEYPMTHHKLTMSPRIIEEKSNRAFYKLLYKSVLDIDLTKKEIDEIIKRGY